MDEAFWRQLFLFLHVLGAIVAFGPTFAFSFIGASGGAEPQHANFATRVSHIARPVSTVTDQCPFGEAKCWELDCPYAAFALFRRPRFRISSALTHV